MMPRALATLTMLLLNPLSCQAMAVASEAGAPFWPAMEPICVASRRPPPATVVGRAAAAAAVVVVVAGTTADGVPAGMRRRVPAMTKESGRRPLAAASAAGVIPLAAAM